MELRDKVGGNSLSLKNGVLPFIKGVMKIIFKEAIYKTPGEPPKIDDYGNPIFRYRFKICVWCWKIIHIPLFNTIIYLLIVANTLILATD